MVTAYVPDDILDVLQSVLFKQDIYEYEDTTCSMADIEKELGILPVFSDVSLRISSHFTKSGNGREFVKIYTDGSTQDSYLAPVGGGGVLILGDNNRVVGALMIEMSSPLYSLSSSHVEAITALVALAFVRKKAHIGIEELLTDSQAVQHHIMNTRPSLLEEETISWCRGHSGNMANEFADKIAKSSRLKAEENYSWSKEIEKTKRPTVQLITPGGFSLEKARFSDNITSDFLRNNIHLISSVSDIHIGAELQKTGRLALVGMKMISQEVGTVHRHVFPESEIIDIASSVPDFIECMVKGSSDNVRLHLCKHLYEIWGNAPTSKMQHHTHLMEYLNDKNIVPHCDNTFAPGDISSIAGMRSRHVMSYIHNIMPQNCTDQAV